MIHVDTTLENLIVFAFLKILLAAMQVGLASKDLQGDETFVTNSAVFAYLRIVVSPVTVTRILLKPS